MKKLNKKGFTIVELVIVIAVIAILAAVLIPTFSSVIKNANKSAAMQEAKVAMEMVAMVEKADLNGTYYVVGEKYVFTYDAKTGLDTDPVEKDEWSLGTNKEIVKYYALDQTTLQGFIGTTVTLVEKDDPATTEVEKVNVIYNEDISKNVYVISVADKAAG